MDKILPSSCLRTSDWSEPASVFSSYPLVTMVVCVLDSSPSHLPSNSSPSLAYSCNLYLSISLLPSTFKYAQVFVNTTASSPSVIPSLFSRSQPNFLSVSYTHLPHSLLTPQHLLIKFLLSLVYWDFFSQDHQGCSGAKASGHFPFLFHLISKHHLTPLTTPFLQVSLGFHDLAFLFSSYLSDHSSSVFFNALSDYCSNVPALGDSAILPLLLLGYLTLANLFC